MQQVGRTMIKYIFLISVTILFSACNSYKIFNNDNKTTNEDIYVTKREYANISKDAIFEAAKKLFILADSKEFRIDAYRDRLQVSKTKMNYYLFFPNTTADFWVLSVDEKDNISKAKLKLYQVTNFEEDSKRYIDSNVHNLFWNRLEYMLGLTNAWKSCKTTWDLEDALCDSISLINFRDARKDDIVKEILISDRKASKSLDEIEQDVLKDDIVLSIDDSGEDILESVSDNIEVEQSNEEESLDKEIEELDKKVNENIDNTLDKIVEEDVSTVEDSNK